MTKPEETQPKIKRRFDKALLDEVLQRDGAKVIQIPSVINRECTPTFECGKCHTDIVNTKTLRSMFIYGAICASCANKINKEKLEHTMLKKYNVKNANDIPGISNKIKETKKNNLGEDFIKDNAKTMVNARWDREKNKYIKIEKNGLKNCEMCNEEKSLDLFICKHNKTRDYNVYSVKCRECHNKKRTDVRDEKRKNNDLNTFLKEIIVDAQRRNKKKGKEFNISVEYLTSIYNKQNGNCYYSNRPMKYQFSKDEHSGKRIHPERMSIDRINSDLGYSIGNVVLCCWISNNIKQDLNIDDFKNIIKDIYTNYIEKINNDTT